MFVLNVPINNYSHMLIDSISYYTVPEMAGLKRFTSVKYAGLLVLTFINIHVQCTSISDREIIISVKPCMCPD